MDHSDIAAVKGAFKILLLMIAAAIVIVIVLKVAFIGTVLLLSSLEDRNTYDTAWIKGKTIEEVVERYGEPHKCLSDPGHDETSPHRSEECRYFENGHGGEDVDFVRCFVDENGIVYNVESAFGWG